MNSATKLFETEKDIVMHIASLMRIAMADGKFLESERNYVEELAASYARMYGTKTFDEMSGLLDGLPRQALGDWEVALCEHPSTAKNLIKDMVVLGHIDGDFCMEERTLVDQFAERVHVGHEVVEKICDIVGRYFNLTNELKRILE